MAENRIVTCRINGVKEIEFIKEKIDYLAIRRISGTISIQGNGIVGCVINDSTTRLNCNDGSGLGHITLDDKERLYKYESKDGSPLSYLRIYVPSGASIELSVQVKF
jgi:hypothetical protein